MQGGVEIIDGQAKIVFDKTKEARITPRYNIRAHFDSVRDMHFVSSHQIIASVSEDCQVKLWNISNIHKLLEDTGSSLQPYFTLRGHCGPIFSITGPSALTYEQTVKKNFSPGSNNVESVEKHIEELKKDMENYDKNCKDQKEKSQKLERLLFTAGQEGNIKVWNLPKFEKDDKFPTTYGRSFQVGSLDDKENQSYLQLKYHPYLHLLLAVKSDSTLQVWDCYEIADNALEYNQENAQESKENFCNLDKPARESLYALQDGTKPQVSCCSWLYTDNNLFVVGYESSHVVFYDQSQGISDLNISHTQLLNEQDPSAIRCIESNQFTPVIAVGHDNGTITLFDYSAKQTLLTKKVENESIKSI